MARTEDAEAKLWELFDRAKTDTNGGARRFDAVVEELDRVYSDRVLRLLRRLDVPESCLADVRNETLHGASKTLRAFRGESTFCTWLLRIATNKAIDLHRRKELYELLSSAIAKKSTSSSVRPSRLVERKQKAALLQKAVERLDPDVRVLVKARLCDDESVADIARKHDIKPNTLQKRLKHAYALLTEWVQEAGTG